MTWRTKVGGGPYVEHRSKAAADREVQDARRRYRAGAKALRMIRVVDPDGNLTVIDFEREAVMERPEVAALRTATRARDRARAAADGATQAWHQAIRDAGASGVPEAAIARAAGTTIGHVRRVLGRR
jgi:hypothetical protein